MFPASAGFRRMPTRVEDDDADLALLSDEELEAELTIAASNAGLDARYRALLAERERRAQDGD
jgi:hypothetical protein